MTRQAPKQVRNQPVRQKPYMPTPEQYMADLGDKGKLHHRSRWRRFVRFLAVMVLLVVLAVAGYAGYIGWSVAKISSHPLSFTPLAADADGRVNVLVLGVGDPGHSGEKLTDSMMVVSLDKRSKRVAQISLPRDLRVPIPGYGSGKINSANAYGGTELTRQVVSDVLGIPIHYYVETNFSGLKGMVDAVGGVDVDVKTRLYDPNYPCEANESRVCGLDILPGVQHMTGSQALQYSRCRKGTCGNDFGRAERQQEVMNLVRAKVARWEVLLDPTKLTPLVAVVNQSLQTDMGAVQMGEFALLWEEAQKHQPVKLVLSTKPDGYLVGAGTSSDLLPATGDFEAISSRVQMIFKQ